MSSQEPATETREDAQSSPPSAVEIFAADGSRIQVDSTTICSHNFRTPNPLSQADLRLLGLVHKRFAQHLAARLSTFLRMECTLTIKGVSGAAFAKFCEASANPTCLFTFELNPMSGAGILDLSLPLSLVVADRLLGGKGRPAQPERLPTEIESALIQDVMHVVLLEWTQLWDADLFKLQPRLLGQESSGKFLRTSPPDTAFLAVNIDISIGETAGEFRLGIPLPMIEPMMVQLRDSQRASTPEPPKKSARWRESYSHIAVPIVARWNVRDLPVSDVLQIREGDIIDLSKALVSDTRLLLSDVESYRGTVGIQNGHIAVQVSGPINQP